jgi:hypothetical protein
MDIVHEVYFQPPNAIQCKEARVQDFASCFGKKQDFSTDSKEKMSKIKTKKMIRK